MAPKRPPQPPAHLAKRGKKLWKSVVENYDLEQHHRDLLQSACEQLDRADSARREIEEHGVILLDRFQQRKQNPAVEVERQAHATFLRCLREMGLDVDPPESRGHRRAGTGV